MERLCFDLDQYGDVGVILKEFNTLHEMDEFIKRFHDTDDVREYFRDKINKFLKTKKAIEYLEMQSKDGNEKNGFINCYHEYDYHKMKKICVLYDNKITDNLLYTKLRRALGDYKVLKKIYDRKYFLIPSQSLKNELRRVVVNHGGKSPFADDFIRYIHNLDPEQNYVYLRSLCDICGLLEHKREKSVVKLTIVAIENIDGIKEYSLKNPGECEIVMEEKNEYQVTSDAPENFIRIFNNAILTNNYEILFNEFTHEEIDLYSDCYRKGRGK